MRQQNFSIYHQRARAWTARHRSGAKYSRPIPPAQNDHALMRSANGFFNDHFTVARDPGLPDAAGLLGAWTLGGCLAFPRRTRLPKLGCHANTAMLPPMPRPVPAPAGDKKKVRRKRQEKRRAAKAAGPRRHYSYEPSTKSTKWWYFFCGEKQQDKIILLYTCMCTCTYMYVNL